jgi:hypothetical protein
MLGLINALREKRYLLVWLKKIVCVAKDHKNLTGMKMMAETTT